MTTALLVAFFACLAALAALLWWQHRTILRLAREAERDNVIKVRLREELWALADKHHDAVPITYFMGLASDKPIARWETPASEQEVGDGNG